MPELVLAIEAQTLRPAFIVVVDSSPSPDDRSDTRAALDATSIPHTYIYSSYGSAAHQRNLGIDRALAWADFDFIAFIDDDTRPAPDYWERLSTLLVHHGQGALGASGTTGPRPYPGTPSRWDGYRRLFLLTGPSDGRLLASGINLAVDASAPQPVQSEWLFGCSLWRRSALEGTRFRDDFPGSSLGEDVEFSARIGQRGTLWVDPQAHLGHLLSDEGRPDVRTHTHRSIRNRYEIVRGIDGGVVGRAAFWWSVLGQGVVYARHVAPRLVGKDHPDHAEHLDRWRGFLSGVRDTVRQEPPR